MLNHLHIDKEAKLVVDLTRLQDQNGDDYFVGKLQFPGTLDLEQGISFMIFTSERDRETLQISPIDHRKRSNKIKRTSGWDASGSIRIDLSSFLDTNKQTVYVGEVMAPSVIYTREGIFFSVYVSKTGREELQIKRLKKPHAKFVSSSGSGEHTKVSGGEYSYSRENDIEEE